MKIINKILTVFLLISFSSSTALAKSSTKEYVVQIKNHKFIPEIVEVPANQKFRLVIKNLDKTVEEFESADLRKEKLVGGGKTIKISVRALKAGEYKFFGEFNQKTARGKVVVK